MLKMKTNQIVCGIILIIQYHSFFLTLAKYIITFTNLHRIYGQGTLLKKLLPTPYLLVLHNENQSGYPQTFVDLWVIQTKLTHCR